MDHYDDIQWALGRVDLIERVDLLQLDESELVAHAELLQLEIRILRAMVKAAVDQLHEKDREIAAARRQQAAHA